MNLLFEFIIVYINEIIVATILAYIASSFFKPNDFYKGE
jgi:hypothetical protein